MSALCIELFSSCIRFLLHLARVVKLVDTRDLKSLGEKSLYRFDSGSGHHIYSYSWLILFSLQAAGARFTSAHSQEIANLQLHY